MLSRRTTARAVALAVFAVAVMSTAPAPATAVGYHAFTPQRPTYTFSDARGRYDNQINYRAAVGRPRMQWSYQVSKLFVAAATGPATEVATLYCNGRRVPGYRDYHAGVGAGYLFHSSYGPLRTGCRYRLNVTITFRTARGIALLVFDDRFYITYV